MLLLASRTAGRRRHCAIRQGDDRAHAGAVISRRTTGSATARACASLSQTPAPARAHQHRQDRREVLCNPSTGPGVGTGRRRVTRPDGGRYPSCRSCAAAVDRLRRIRRQLAAPACDARAAACRDAMRGAINPRRHASASTATSCRSVSRRTAPVSKRNSGSATTTSWPQLRSFARPSLSVPVDEHAHPPVGKHLRESTQVVVIVVRIGPVSRSNGVCAHANRWPIFHGWLLLCARRVYPFNGAYRSRRRTAASLTLRETAGERRESKATGHFGLLSTPAKRFGFGNQTRGQARTFEP